MGSLFSSRPSNKEPPEEVDISGCPSVRVTQKSTLIIYKGIAVWVPFKIIRHGKAYAPIFKECLKGASEYALSRIHIL